MLATAAVIGRDFELDVLANVVRRPADEVLGVVETAIAASLVTEAGARGGGFRFVHALIAQALVDELSVARRTQTHERVAAEIELLHGPDLGERVGALARHLLAAGTDVAKAVEYARRAGRHALAALAPDEAQRWFAAARDALQESGSADPQLSADLAADLGEAMRDAGHPEMLAQLVAATQAAERLQDGDRMARPLLADVQNGTDDDKCRRPWNSSGCCGGRWSCIRTRASTVRCCSASSAAELLMVSPDLDERDRAW